MKTLKVLLATALLTGSTLAMAVGPEQGDKSFTVAGNGTSDKDFDDTAYGVSGELGYFLTDSWQAGLRQSVNGVVRDEGSNDWAGATRGFIQYNFLDGTYRPYLGANIGGIYGEAASDTGAAGLEAGLKLYVLQKTYINFGIEYAWFFDDSDDIDSSFEDGAYLYSLGVGFNW